MTCIFCSDETNDRNLYETKNFFVKVGKGIITAGHVMIIPKHHYKAIGEIDNNLIDEYLNLKQQTIKKITENFAEPFLIEYGNYGQSVFHAHIHLIPKTGNGYKNVDLYKEMILPSKTTTIQINNFNELRDYYLKHNEYIYFEDKNKYILPITNIIRNNLGLVGYRTYFDKLGLKGIRSWASMTEEDIKNDNLKIEETKKKLKYNLIYNQ